jgi:hypothetical protein
VRQLIARGFVVCAGRSAAGARGLRCAVARRRARGACGVAARSVGALEPGPEQRALTPPRAPPLLLDEARIPGGASLVTTVTPADLARHLSIGCDHFLHLSITSDHFRLEFVLICPAEVIERWVRPRPDADLAACPRQRGVPVGLRVQRWAVPRQTCLNGSPVLRCGTTTGISSTCCQPARSSRRYGSEKKCMVWPDSSAT